MVGGRDFTPKRNLLTVAEGVPDASWTTEVLTRRLVLGAERRAWGHQVHGYLFDLIGDHEMGTVEMS